MGARTASTARRLPLLVALVLSLVASLLPASTAFAAHINLTFTTQPGDGLGGQPLSVQPVVHADDAGSPVSGLAVTLQIRPQNNTVDATLSCTSGLTVVTNGAGDAVFTGCEIDLAQDGFRLRATAPHASPQNSAASGFDVDPGPAHHLVFTSHPADPSPALLTPQPAVMVVDEGGNRIVTATNLITLSIDQNPGTFSCTGGLSLAAVAGVAAFSGCAQATGGVDYNLTATTTGLTDNDVTGPDFDVLGQNKLQFCWGTTLPCVTTPPSNVTGGTPFPVQPVVRVLDGGNNTITTDNTTVITLSKTPGTPASGGPGTLACPGGLSRPVVNGVAAFAGCAIDLVGAGYRIRASSNPVLTAVDSNAFNVAVGPAAKLGFLTQPTGGTAGQALTPAITVAVQDAGGNTVTTGQSAAITLLIANNTTNAVLTCPGGNPVAAINGVATFPGCTIDRGGTFQLTATPGGVVPPGNITPATSAPFTLQAGPAQISLAASSNVITWGDTVVLTVQFGALGGNRPFTMQSSTDGTTWTTIQSAPLITGATGQGVFAYRPARNLYYRAVFAGAPDLAAAMSNVQRVVVRQIALLRPTNLGAVDSIPLGTTIRFTTTVRPARPELPRATVTFVVYRLVGRTWTQAASQDVTIDANGLASVNITFGQSGKWYVRSIARPTSANANSVWSPVERYDVP